MNVISQVWAGLLRVFRGASRLLGSRAATGLAAYLAIAIALGSLAVSYEALKFQRNRQSAAETDHWSGSLRAVRSVEPSYPATVLSGTSPVHPAVVKLLWQQELVNTGEQPMTIIAVEHGLCDGLDGPPLTWDHEILTLQGDILILPHTIRPGDAMSVRFATDVPLSAAVYKLLEDSCPIGDTAPRVDLDKYLGTFGIDLWGNHVEPYAEARSGYMAVSTDERPGYVPCAYINLYTARGQVPYGRVSEYAVYSEQEAEQWRRNQTGKGTWDGGVPVEPAEVPSEPDS